MKTSWKAAGIVVIVLTVWMLSGLFASDKSTDEVDADSVKNVAMAVEIMVTEPTRMSKELDLRGQIDPVRQVLVKAQTSGEVNKLIEHKGARVSAGAALVKLNESGRANLLAEAQAAVRSAQSEQAAAKSLQKQRLQSQLQLEQADAVLEAALARLASVQLDIDHTTIKAPFSGVLNDLPVELGALIERGDVIAELVDDSAFKVTASVAQQGLSQLTLGQIISVELLTGQNLKGTLSFIGSVAEPQTRSFAVEALIENDGSAIASGVSATLSIPVEEVEATFITPAALSLGVDGSLGVKALDDQDNVIFLPIQMVSTALDGAWVSGIPAQTRLITLGHGFVNVGEKVRPQVAGGS